MTLMVQVTALATVDGQEYVTVGRGRADLYDDNDEVRTMVHTSMVTSLVDKVAGLTGHVLCPDVITVDVTRVEMEVDG